MGRFSPFVNKTEPELASSRSGFAVPPPHISASIRALHGALGLASAP